MMNNKRFCIGSRLVAASIGILCGLDFGDATYASEAGQGIPIRITAEKQGFVTLVIEDKDGNRLKNLVFDHPVHPGINEFQWDGSTDKGEAKPGDFIVRGLFHEDIVPKLEYTFYT